MPRLYHAHDSYSHVLGHGVHGPLHHYARSGSCYPFVNYGLPLVSTFGLSYGSIGYASSPVYDPGYYVDSEPVLERPVIVDANAAPQGREIGEPATQEGASTYVEQGHAAFAAGNYDEARRLLTRAVLADEDDSYAQVTYGLTDFALGRYRSAASSIRRGVAADPSLIDAPPDLEALYGNRDELAGHRAALEAYVAGHPDSDAHLLLGFVYYSSGDARRAVEQFDRAIQIQPDDTLTAMLRDAAGSVVPAREGVEPPPMQP